VTRRTILDDYPKESAIAIDMAGRKGARDAVLVLHATLEIEARAGLAWWAAYFAMLDAVRG